MRENRKTARKVDGFPCQPAGPGGENELDELKTLAQPLADYLRKNHHPHTAIVITDERVVVVEDVMSVPVKESN